MHTVIGCIVFWSMRILCVEDVRGDVGSMEDVVRKRMNHGCWGGGEGKVGQSGALFKVGRSSRGNSDPQYVSIKFDPADPLTNH